MKVSKRNIYLLVLLFATLGGKAQEWSLPGGQEAPYESFLLVSDRAHYICGEEVGFRAFALHRNETRISSTLYVELISPFGYSLHRSKIAIGNKGASGTFKIPMDIPSGTYYLKAYTRLMRNCGDEMHSYASIQVYNPFSNEANDTDTSEGVLAPSRYRVPGQGDDQAEIFQARLSSTLAGKREGLSLILSDALLDLDMSISVARKGLFAQQQYYLSKCRVSMDRDARFVPEPRGPSLSGRVVGPEGEAAAYASVFMSFLDQEAGFFCNYADSAGRFYFSLPAYTGMQEVFVSAAQENFDSLRVMVDSDFSAQQLPLPSYPVLRDTAMVDLLNEMNLNAGMAAQYATGVKQAEPPDEKSGMFFYGKPDVKIDFSDFIRLPTLAEYFTEVIPQVNLRKVKGKYRFIVNGEHPDLRIYPPLLMIDGVAILDSDAILAVSPGLIDHVELVTAPYVRGNVSFGGIISLVTTSGDMGYIDLPSSGLLLSYQMLDKAVATGAGTGEEDQRLPDLRNTLFWSPSLKLEAGAELPLEFHTADTAGDYEIVITASGPDGQIIRRVLEFSVGKD